MSTCQNRRASRSSRVLQGADLSRPHHPIWSARCLHGIRIGYSPSPFCLHGYFSLSFPSTHHGPGPAHRLAENHCPAHGRWEFRSLGAFLGQNLGLNFTICVVTGIPLEFQCGTNWAEFSKTAGGVIGQTLAMEGVFSFFLESSFLGLFLFGEKKLGRIGHWLSVFLVFLGSWLSGYFIIATNAWMQHPTGYRLGPSGTFELKSFWGLLLNPWTLWQYPHTMMGALQTGCFVMATIGAFYILAGPNEDDGRTFVRVGVIAGVIA